MSDRPEAVTVGGPTRRASRRVEVLRRRPRAARRRHRAARRRGARADGRERRRQVDAGQGPGRRRPAATTASMLVDGAPVDFHSPHDARDAGHRRDLPGADALPGPERRGERRHGLPPARRAAAGSTAARCARTVQGLLDRLGVRLDPERPVRGLSIADQQIVEIAKALSFDARVLIMDEPTAALSGPEVERLFTVVRALREEGAAILFISHRLDEVFAICDTVTVMRDGAVVHDAPIADHDAGRHRPADGRARAERAVPEAGRAGRRHRCCSVHRLTREGVFFDVSFEVRAGRDRRARRARRRRAQRGGARDLRHRQARRRPRRGRRPAACPPAGRSRRCAPASASCPRTAASRGS